jgi:hypothetical protein
MRDRDEHWDDEPIGSLDSGIARRWRRPWNHYLSIMVGAVGLIMVIGALGGGPDWSGIAGGLCVLAVPLALAQSDGPRAKSGRPPPAPPSMTTEIAWLLVAVLLLVVGFTLASR